MELKKEKLYREKGDKKLGVVRKAHQVEMRNLHYKVFYMFQAKYHKKVEGMNETFRRELFELRDQFSGVKMDIMRRDILIQKLVAIIVSQDIAYIQGKTQQLQ